jgi:hypothetical protein
MYVSGVNYVLWVRIPPSISLLSEVGVGSSSLQDHCPIQEQPLTKKCFATMSHSIEHAHCCMATANSVHIYVGHEPLALPRLCHQQLETHL